MSFDKERGLKKCVVWDLDGTLWEGTLLEGGAQALRPGMEEVIVALDARGVLHATASRNDRELALAKLRTFGLEQYFVTHEIGWGAKSESIEAIAERLGLSVESFVFVDDDPFERESVQHALPRVETVDASEAHTLGTSSRFGTATPTAEARARRTMLRAEESRREAETRFGGTSSEFLRTLGLRLTVFRAREEDLGRAEELTLRTNQLNTTGVGLSRDELVRLCASPNHDVWLARLEDKYGVYGTIGLSLITRTEHADRIELFLLSCRVLGRGIAESFLDTLVRLSEGRGARIEAAFIDNGRNRPMRITYQFFGFRPKPGAANTLCYEAPPQGRLPSGHVHVVVEGA